MFLLGLGLETRKGDALWTDDSMLIKSHGVLYNLLLLLLLKDLDMQSSKKLSCSFKDDSVKFISKLESNRLSGFDFQIPNPDNDEDVLYLKFLQKVEYLLPRPFLS
jgi:hypothetical protein